MADTSLTSAGAQDLARLRQWVWASLRPAGPRQASIESLMDLFESSPDVFYRLATCGVEDAADEWAKSLARLATRVRSLVRSGFDIHRGDRLVVVHSGTTSERFNVRNAEEANRVVGFFHRLSGTSTSNGTARDCEGTAVSEAELEFKLGDLESWQSEASHAAVRMSQRPVVARLDDSDRRAVEGGLPAYVSHGLRFSVTELLQVAQVQYVGLRGAAGWSTARHTAAGSITGTTTRDSVNRLPRGCCMWSTSTRTGTSSTGIGSRRTRTTPAILSTPSCDSTRTRARARGCACRYRRPHGGRIQPARGLVLGSRRLRLLLLLRHPRFCGADQRRPDRFQVVW